MKAQLRSLLLGISFIGLLCIPQVASAEVIDSFQADIQLLPDNSALITETIEYDFAGSSDDRHGIYRDIPRLYTLTGQCGGDPIIDPASCTKDVFHPIDVISVTDEAGVDQPYTTTESSAEWLRIKIGDPDKTVSGTHTYIITYAFSAPMTHDVDQKTVRFFWNITGNGWNVDIKKVSAAVHFSGMNNQSVACFVGYAGSTESDCSTEIEGRSLRIQSNRMLRSGQGLTIDAIFEGDQLPPEAGMLQTTVTMPDCFLTYCITSDPVLRLQSGDGQEDTREWEVSVINAVGDTLLIALPGNTMYQATVEAFLHTPITTSIDFTQSSFVESDFALYKNSIGKFMNTALPIMASVLYLIIVIGLWYFYGRDPRVSSVVVTEFLPPKDITPMEMGIIIDGDVKQSHMAAQIVNLAVRGYITIEQRKQEGVSRFLQSGEYDYIYHAVTKNIVEDWDTEALTTVDRLFLTEFFGEKAGVRNHVDMKALKSTFHKAVYQIHKAVIDSVVQKGFFTRSPRTIKSFMVTAAVLWIAGAVATFFYFDSLFAIVCGVPVGIIGSAMALLMGQQTPAGAKMRRYIQGYKKYLSVAEKDRIAFFNNPKEYTHVFESVLPYAMILGVEEQWSEQFTDLLTEQPTWYTGSATHAFVMSSFISDIHSFSSTMSSSSVVSGAGSAGGGFGGGGGGSW